MTQKIACEIRVIAVKNGSDEIRSAVSGMRVTATILP
jgi:hypothetical protein